MKEIKKHLEDGNYNVKIVIDLRTSTEAHEAGLPPMIKLHALRADVHAEGTKWYNPITWGDDMKMGLIVNRENIPLCITDEELQYRVQFLEIGNKRKMVGIRTQKRLLGMGFVNNFAQYMNHKWGPDDFRTAVQWGKILAWTLVATIAVGIAVYYCWDKICGLGRAIANGFKKVGGFFKNLVTWDWDSEDDDNPDPPADADKEPEEEKGTIKETYDNWMKEKKESMISGLVNVVGF